MSDPTPTDKQPLGEAPEQDFADPGHAALSESLRWVFRLVPLGMAAVVAMFLATGVYNVKEGEVALELRFGKVTKAIDPGWEFRWPYPFEDHVVYATREFTFVTNSFWLGDAAAEKVRQAEDATDPMEATANVTLEPGIDGYVLTGDRQIYHMQLRVLYRIDDPMRVYRTVGGKELFPLRLRNQPSEKMESFIRGVVDPAVVKVASRYSVTELYQGATRATFLNEVQDLIEQELQRLDCGIVVTDVLFGATTPPPKTIRSFKQVVEARNISQQFVDRARQEASTIASEAEAEVARIKQEANIYARRTVALANARKDEIENFETKYGLKPGQPLPDGLLAFLEIRRLRTIREVMEEAEERFLLTVDETGKDELRINLDRDPQALKEVRQMMRQREEEARERERALRGVR